MNEPKSAPAASDETILKVELAGEEFALPVVLVSWAPCWRVIPSRFPPVDLFERVAPPEDWDAIIEVELLTNPRRREELGLASFVPEDQRATGPGADAIMAPFRNPNPDGSRFSDGSFGVLYAAHSLETAVAESRYHRELFLRATQEPAMEITMRVYTLGLKASMCDIRDLQEEMKSVYNPDDWSVGRLLGAKIRAQDMPGIVYFSVRDPKGECVAGFRADAFFDCKQERHFGYIWNGESITHVIVKKLYQP